MLTGQSMQACLRREVPADHEAHSQAKRRQLQRVAMTELRRDHDPDAEAEQGKRDRLCTKAPVQDGEADENQSTRTTVHDRGKKSRAKPDERCRSPFAMQTLGAEAPATRRSRRRTRVDHTRHGRIHDHAKNTDANRALVTR